VGENGEQERGTEMETWNMFFITERSEDVAIWAGGVESHVILSLRKSCVHERVSCSFLC
jgi:hypothetical protein